MNESDHKALTLVVKTLYYRPRYLSIPFRQAKRDLMRLTRLNRWRLDKWLLDLQAQTASDEGAHGFTRAFYLMKCVTLPTSRLNYISAAQRGEETSENSFCFLQFDLRNKYMKAILAELERGYENV